MKRKLKKFGIPPPDAPRKTPVWNKLHIFMASNNRNSMKKLTAKTLLTALILWLSMAASAATPSYTLNSGGLERTYFLHVPDGLPDRAPLVIFLHGYGGRADPGRFGLNETADRHGFAVCYPEGEKNGRGKQGWNVGYPVQHDMNVDDAEFLADLVAHLRKKHDLGLGSVFCSGYSNGGDMCYQISSQHPGLFTAVGSVGGLMFEWVYRSDTSTTPVPLLEIHGTADKTSRWDGDLDNEGGWGEYVSVPMAAHYWAAKNKCTKHVAEPMPCKKEENSVTLHRFTGGTDGCEVWLCEIEGGPHSWSADYIDTNELLWSFFSRYVE